MIIALILSGVACLIILYLLIAMFLSIFDIYLWPCDNDIKDYPKLSYKQFIDYYWINPDKWKLYDGCVEYKCNKKENLEDNMIMTKMWILNQTTNNSSFEKISSGINNNIKFSFPFIDQFKYRKFKYDIETNKAKMKQSKAHSKAYEFLLNGVQEDIDKLRQQSEDEINQAMETMKEVKERVG